MSGRRKAYAAVAKADAARDQRDWAAAAAGYRAALKLKPRLAHIWVQLGHALKESGDLQEAEKDYVRALRIAPQIADTHLNLGHLRKLQGRLPEAAAAYRHVLTLEPGNADATRELAALPDQPAIPHTPRQAVSRRSIWLSRDRRAASAIAAADLARDRREWIAAADGYRDALKLKPRLAHIWVQLGHALKESGDLQGAGDSYERALRIAPRDADAHLNLGHLRKLQGRLPEAAAAYARALALDLANADAKRELEALPAQPPSPPAPPRAPRSWRLPRFSSAKDRQAAVAAQAGDAARDRREWLAAADSYRAALRLNPRLNHIRVQLGHALKESGEPGPAETAYREALARDPASADIHMNLGHALKLQLRLEDAAGAYLRALEIEPHNRDALRELHALCEQGVVCDAARFTAAVGAETPTDMAGGRSGQSIMLDITALVRSLREERSTYFQRSVIRGLSGFLDEPPSGLDIEFCAFNARVEFWSGMPAGLVRNLFNLILIKGDRQAEAWVDACMAVETLLRVRPPLAFAAGAFLFNLDAARSQPNYHLAVRAAKDRHQVRYIPFIHEPPREFSADVTGAVLHADGLLAGSQATRDGLIKLVAHYALPAPSAISVVDPDSSEDLDKQIAGLVRSWPVPSPPRTALFAASPDTYYGLAGKPDPAAKTGVVAGEMFRTGDNWWWPEAWGCWTKPGGAQISLTTPDNCDELTIYVGLRGVPEGECPYRVDVEGAEAIRGVLTAGELKWVAARLPRPGDRVARISITGQANHLFKPGAGHGPGMASIGVIGFMVAEGASDRATAATLPLSQAV